MDQTFFQALAVAGVFAVAITLLISIFRENSKVKEVTDLVTNFLPQLITVIKDVTVAIKPEKADLMAKVEEAARKAVYAVEQISKGVDLTPQEKKDMAIEFYKQLADDLGLPELSAIQVKTLDILIENIVLEMNSLAEKKAIEGK